MNRKKILFVMPFFPYPIVSGGHMALLNGILAVKDNYDVYITFGVNDKVKYDKVKGEFVKIIPNAYLFPLYLYNDEQDAPEYPAWYRIASKLKNYIRNKVCKSRKEQSGNDCDCHNEMHICSRWISAVSPLQEVWLEHITKICSEHHFDLIQVEMPWLISLILTLPEKPRKIFVHHELGFIRRQQELSLYDNNQYVYAYKLFVDLVEINLLNKYDAIITLSKIDKEKLLLHGVKTPVYSSFAIVNSANAYKHRIFLGDGKQLSFVGPDGHSPNLIGITWFLENCWEKLKKIDDGYRLKIIGKWDTNHVLDYSSRFPDVEFVGFVDDLDGAIRGTVMIVPITIGSGIRMKILEACSMGVPFVSTTIGAEGLPVKDGENCFIADTPDQFVDKILELQNTTIQRRFINNAYDMVINNYSLEALKQNRLSIYKEIFVSV